MELPAMERWHDDGYYDSEPGKRFSIGMRSASGEDWRFCIREDLLGLWHASAWCDAKRVVAGSVHGTGYAAWRELSLFASDEV